MYNTPYMHVKRIGLKTNCFCLFFLSFFVVVVVMFCFVLNLVEMHPIPIVCKKCKLLIFLSKWSGTKPQTLKERIMMDRCPQFGDHRFLKLLS